MGRSGDATLALVLLEKSSSHLRTAGGARSSALPSAWSPGHHAPPAPRHPPPRQVGPWLTWVLRLSFSHTHIPPAPGTPFGLRPTTSDPRRPPRKLRTGRSPAASRDSRRLRPGSSQNRPCHWAPERTRPWAGSRGLKAALRGQGGVSGPADQQLRPVLQGGVGAEGKEGGAQGQAQDRGPVAEGWQELRMPSQQPPI